MGYGAALGAGENQVKDFGLLGVAVLLGGVGVFLQTSGGDSAAYGLLAFLAAGLAFCAQIIVSNTRRGVLVTALLAVACNAYLLNMKFNPAAEAICDVGGKIGCTAINSSAASELFGLPVTLYGVGFYLGLALASLGDPKRTPRFDQVNGLFALASLAFSAYLGWEAKKIGLFCPFCISIYGCNLLLLWSAFKGMKEQGTTLFGGVEKIFGTASLWVITASFAFITLIGASAWQGHDEIEVTVDHAGKVDPSSLTHLYARPKGPVKTDGTEPIYGDPNAPITVVEFADYSCPHCAHAAPVLKEIVAANPDIRLLFKAFPLSGACNPVIGGEEGVERCKAAMAAECAGDQNMYYELSGMMFKSLGYRADADLQYMAQEVGLDMERWTACMQSQATVTAVVDDARAGAEAQVEGTPTLFVNGLVGDDWIVITQGPEALEALLKAKAAGAELPAPR